MTAARVRTVLEALSLALLLAMLAALFTSWQSIPERVPLHFGASGRPDRWGGRGAIPLLALLSAGVYALLTVIARFPELSNMPVAITDSNREAQYENIRLLLAAVKLQVIAVFAWILWRTILVAKGEASGLGPGFLLMLLGTLLPMIGFFLWRAKKLE